MVDPLAPTLFLSSITFFKKVTRPVHVDLDKLLQLLGKIACRRLRINTSLETVEVPQVMLRRSLGLCLRTRQRWISNGEYDASQEVLFASRDNGVVWKLLGCTVAPMPQMAEETIEMERSSPRERVQQRTSEHVSTETVEVVALVPRERQQHTAVQIVLCTSISGRDRRRGDVIHE